MSLIKNGLEYSKYLLKGQKFEHTINAFFGDSFKDLILLEHNITSIVGVAEPMSVDFFGNFELINKVLCYFKKWLIIS